MEPIHWHKLTPAQRDAEIHEKVFGYARETATHTSQTSAGYPFSFTITFWQVGGLHIPRYSQSLDAAWLLWAKLAEGDESEAFMRQCKFVCAWDDDDEMLGDWQLYNAYSPFLTVGQMVDVTPERICICALRALDYEVLTEKVKAVE